MTELLAHSSLHPQLFIALGGVLLIAELLGTGGYSLWSGLSAIIVGIIAWMIPVSWSTLWILFAIFTLLTAYIWCIWLKKNEHKSTNDTLNQPQKSLIGLTTIVVEPIVNGNGRVKVQDGPWTAQSDEDIELGTKVKVVAVDGIILKVVRKTNN